MTSKRLVELYNRIHQFDAWTFAVLDFEGEPVIVLDGKLLPGQSYLLRTLRIHIMSKVATAGDAVEREQERHAILQEYEKEIKSYLKEEEDGKKVQV